MELFALCVHTLYIEAVEWGKKREGQDVCYTNRERESYTEHQEAHFSSNSYSVSIGVNVGTDFDTHILVPVTVYPAQKAASR